MIVSTTALMLWKDKKPVKRRMGFSVVKGVGATPPDIFISFVFGNLDKG